MGARDLRHRTVLVPTPRELENWQSIRLLAQGWNAPDTAQAQKRDPHIPSNDERRPVAREDQRP